ncbi:Uridine-cytidine kinase 2-B [Amphibalanus amphitrite]|uniref:Uridine-cytidine kinase 2-B n=1 Tax=Amphibalanus amphitrite TaxID=1232801 RepID=A0A6A4WF64_AMPAM|nr:Uridine-cytidine kinase 2-B [Amphibalanus amphitrite]
MERLGQEAIEQEHRRVVCISQDSFYRNLSSHQSELARRGQINFDHPAGKANGITVVNNFAERGVALMEAYNLTLTKDEDQRQYILQVVEAHRGRFPNASKGTVTRRLE